MTVPLHFYLLLAAALFATGAVGFLLRRNLLAIVLAFFRLRSSVRSDEANTLKN
jgi:NADH-quinone oxidoreductase subunit K